MKNVSERSSIVVIDPDKMVRLVLGRMLTQKCHGFNIVTSQHTIDALTILDTRRVALFVIDYDPLREDTLHLIHTIHTRSPRTPLLAISRYSAFDVEHTVRFAGAHAFLAKAFSMQAFTTLVHLMVQPEVAQRTGRTCTSN